MPGGQYCVERRVVESRIMNAPPQAPSKRAKKKFFLVNMALDDIIEFGGCFPPGHLQTQHH